MLIVALVLAVIGLAALVTAVVTSNELIAWVCIAASVIGVVLLIVDALRDRSKGEAEEEPADEYVGGTDAETTSPDVEDYPDEPPVADYQDEPDPAAVDDRPDEASDAEANQDTPKN